MAYLGSRFVFHIDIAFLCFCFSSLFSYLYVLFVASSVLSAVPAAKLHARLETGLMALFKRAASQVVQDAVSEAIDGDDDGLNYAFLSYELEYLSIYGFRPGREDRYLGLLIFNPYSFIDGGLFDLDPLHLLAWTAASTAVA